MLTRVLCIGVAIIALAGCRFEKFTSDAPLFTGTDMPISADAPGFVAMIGDHPDEDGTPEAEPSTPPTAQATGPKYSDAETSARLLKFFDQKLGIHFPSTCTMSATKHYIPYLTEIRGMKIFRTKGFPDFYNWSENGEDTLPPTPPVNAAEHDALQAEINKFGTIPDDVCHPAGDTIIRYVGQGQFKMETANINDLFNDEAITVTFHKIGGNRLTGERYVAQAKIKQFYGYEFFERSVLGTVYIYTAKEGVPSELTKNRKFKSKEEVLAFAEDVFNERGFTKDDIGLTELSPEFLRKFDTVITCRNAAITELSKTAENAAPDPDWSCF